MDRYSVEGPTRLSPAIWISIIPALAYSLAFAYEAGYAQTFHIPLQLIVITWTAVFIALFVVVGVVGPIMYWANILLIFSPGENPTKKFIQNPVARQFLPIVLLTPLSAILAVIYGWSFWREWVWLIVLGGMFTAINLVWPLLHFKEKSYRAKIEATEKADRNAPTLLDRIARRSRKGFLAAVFLVVLLGISWSVGNAQALRQSKFFVLTSSPNEVVLRIYGDRLVIGEYDTTKRRLTGTITLMSLSGSGVVLRETRVGPLKPAP